MDKPLSLAEACEELVDCVNRTAPESSDGEYYAVGTPAMRGNVIDLSEARRISAETFTRWTRRLVPVEGDLLIAREAPVGPVVRVPPGGRIAAGQRTTHLRANPLVVHPRYLFYLLISPRVQGQLLARAMGSTVPHLRVADLKSFQLPALPALSEQQAIADVLGAVDDKIAVNQQLGRIAIELADSLFSALQRSAETRATIGKLVDQGVLEVGDGYRTKRPEHGQPGLRILRAGDVRDFQLFPTGDDFVSVDYSRQMGAKASQPGDVIMTTKGTVGRVAFVSSRVEQVVYSPQICYFRVVDTERLSPGYLAAWFRSADLQGQTGGLMYKSDMAPYINLRDIRSLSVPLVSSDELRRQGEQQRALLERFDACGAENERLARTRDELLPLLMSGEIRVKDAEAVVSDVL